MSVAGSKPDGSLPDSRAFQFPCFALDKQQGTIDQLDNPDELSGYEYYDVAGGDLEFWDAVGRRISFEDTSRNGVKAFRFLVSPEGESPGWERMAQWANRYGVAIDAMADRSLPEIFSRVAAFAPAAVTSLRGRPPASLRIAPGPGRINRLFGDLKVRPKLIILHNLFFLILTAAVYFSLVPIFERQIQQSREREIELIKQVHPNKPEEWRQLIRTTDASVARLRLAIFLVLGLIYVLAVATLEFAIMPLYVYRPLRLMLDADEASLAGDRGGELIPEEQILGDEIGQIMRSRNATVTALRQHEDDLIEKNELIARQDRLARLGLMSASVAHEINTPLAVLHGSIEKLAETAPNVQTADRLARMKKMTERLRTISATLLDFARPRPPRMEPVALRALIEESWQLVVAGERAESIRFRNSTSESAMVMGDADRLIQVFVNVLRNAVNAVPPDGTIEVKSAREETGGRVFIVVRVEDNGKGISPDVLPGIFEAFVSTRLDAKGTGLGLTVAKGIVEQHGGSMAASNRPAGGACLEIRLLAGR